MRCSNCNTELTQSAKFCSNCGTPVPTRATGVNTGGGAYVRGSVTAAGDFVGRDQIMHGNYTRTTQSGLQGDDLAKFTQLYRGV